MISLIGQTWGSLAEQEQNEILNLVSGSNIDEAEHGEEFTLDFDINEENMDLSIRAARVDYEDETSYEIEDTAVFYNTRV